MPLVDYVDTLLNALNEKARTKKQCKKKGLKGDKCYRGYTWSASSRRPTSSSSAISTTIRVRTASADSDLTLRHLPALRPCASVAGPRETNRAATTPE